jgi:LPXTG-motif cell wall-anchored protein
MINKITNREDVGIMIESKSLGGEELGINKATANAIGLVMAIILPVAILILGAIVFFRRKNK